VDQKMNKVSRKIFWGSFPGLVAHAHAKAQSSQHLTSRKGAKVAKAKIIIKTNSLEGYYGLSEHIYLCALCVFA
jgi:hypothetical protein